MLPENIGNLTNLTHLDLRGNQIKSFSRNIENLTELDLSNNQLCGLPEGIENFTNLNRLKLGNNQLTTVSS